MKRYDVTIIGAGLAGLQCARLLSTRGLSVLLVDRKDDVGHAVHTTGIFVRKTLEDFDLPEACLGPAISEVTLYSPRGKSLCLKSDKDEFRVGKMAQLYRHLLGEAIASGIEWSPNTRYTNCEPINGSSLLRLENQRGSRHVRARFIIGADGANSRVARDLGLSRNRQWIVGVEDVLTELPDKTPPAMHCFFDPQLAPGYIAWFVNDGHEAHIGVGGTPDAFNPSQALQIFRERISERFGLANATQVERRADQISPLLIPISGILPKIASRRGLLVGDAAGAVSPLTAGGLDACMRLSELAASVTVAHLEEGREGALDPYNGERFAPRFISRRFMRHLFQSFQQPHLMELAFGMLKTPPFRALARHVLFGRGGSFPVIPETRVSRLKQREAH